jgi:sugar phosphate isomerase/epimerase
LQAGIISGNEYIYEFMNRLCIHSITNKPWSIDTLIEKYTRSGVPALTVWEDAIKEPGAKRAGDQLTRSGLEVVSYCRGGFFPDPDAAKREVNIDKNKRMIEEAAVLAAPLLVLVCGADPGQSLQHSRDQITSGIEAVLPFAADAGVKLAIEPLHPMYADTRSAINTLSHANDLAEYFDSDWVGVAIDVYHVWWDPKLEEQIQRCGKNGNILAFHISDWRVPTEDLLLDREIMGRGCIPIGEISRWVDEAGFDGFREVEIFSDRYWNEDQDSHLRNIIAAYQDIFHKS